jgi:hypothetical protein
VRSYLKKTLHKKGLVGIDLNSNPSTAKKKKIITGRDEGLDSKIFSMDTGDEKRSFFFLPLKKTPNKKN